jgi:hypothetical protein
MSVRGSITAIATAAMLGGCGGSGPKIARAPAAPDLSVPPTLIAGQALHFPGEYLAWKVKWKGFAGGRAQLVVGEPGSVGSEDAIIVRSITETKGLVAVFKHIRDELTTVIDLAGGAPLRADNLLEAGKASERIDIEFGGKTYRIQRRLNGGGETGFTQRVPDDASWSHDLHSIMAHLRAWTPSPGERGYFYIQSGRSFFHVELHAVATEEIETELGRLEAMKLDGSAKLLAQDGKVPPSQVVRSMTMWLSTDPLRLPLKMVAETGYGDVYAVLVEHRPGRALERRTHVVGSRAAERTAIRKSTRSEGVKDIQAVSE